MVNTTQNITQCNIQGQKCGTYCTPQNTKHKTHKFVKTCDSAVNPGGARWGRSLLISAPNFDPLLRLGRVSSQSPRGPLGAGHACVHKQQRVLGSSILSNLSRSGMKYLLGSLGASKLVLNVWPLSISAITFSHAAQLARRD